MSKTRPQTISTPTGLPAPAVSRLLAAVCEAADTHADLGLRRLALIQSLRDLLDADYAGWAWGRGWPDSGSVSPVAYISVGVDDVQRAMLMQWGFDLDADREFRGRIRRQMGQDLHATTIWQDIFSPDEWAARPHMGRLMDCGGWSSWLHTVRYSDRDTWSNLLLFRNAGKPDFGAHEKSIVELVLQSIPWLRSTALEYVPPESLAPLTSRQRTVMLMILDGLPRKTIALRLGISEETVGDHIKALYAQLGVNSSSELARLFLRGR